MVRYVNRRQSPLPPPSPPPKTPKCRSRRGSGGTPLPLHDSFVAMHAVQTSSEGSSINIGTVSISKPLFSALNCVFSECVVKRMGHPARKRRMIERAAALVNHQWCTTRHSPRFPSPPFRWLPLFCLSLIANITVMEVSRKKGRETNTFLHIYIYI